MSRTYTDMTPVGMTFTTLAGSIGGGEQLKASLEDYSGWKVVALKKLTQFQSFSYCKFVFLGNTSIAGDYFCLLRCEMRKEAESIASRMTYMELSTSEKFMDEYISHVLTTY